MFFGVIHDQTNSVRKEIAESMKGPRLIQTHLPLTYFKQQIDKHPNLKVIQVMRNAKDTLVSFYHFYRMEKRCGGFNGSWNDFFKLVENKELAFGDYFDYYSNWYVYNKQRKNSLILVYEDMKKNLKLNVKKIAEFLDKKVSDDVINIIATRTTFGNIGCVTQKGPLCPESLSYQMKDGRTLLRPPFFWYGPDLFFFALKSRVIPKEGRVRSFFWYDIDSGYLKTFLRNAAHMKADKMLRPWKDNNPTTTGRSEPMRKGIVGDYKGYFNEEQNQLIEQRCRDIGATWATI